MRRRRGPTWVHAYIAAQTPDLAGRVVIEEKVADQAILPARQAMCSESSAA